MFKPDAATGYRLQAAIDMLNTLGQQYEVMDNGCWYYTGKVGTGENRRCTILMGTKGTTAGRVICTVVNGPPPGHAYQAGHSCNNAPCINPSHFQWEHADDNQVKNTTGMPKGVRVRNNGSVEAHIKKNGKHHYKSFTHIDNAVEWLEGVRNEA